MAEDLRVLWPHNFDQEQNPNAGVFMELSREALREVGIEPKLLFLGNLRSLGGIVQARKLVRRVSSEFDLIHSQFGSACALSSIGHGRPTLISLRGSDWTPAYSPTLRGRVHALLATRMTRLALMRASGAVCVSQRIAGEVSAYYADLSVCVAPDPIDLNAFRPRNRQDCRLKLGLRPDAKYVLFTTGYTTNPLKRLGLARAAVAQAQIRIPKIELLVASDYPHDEMPLVVSAADCALLTSVAEGWPNCVKEALACDVPFVSTDVSDLKTISDKDTRCHVVNDSPTALGDSLVAVLSEQQPTEGLRSHLSKMTFDAFASQMGDYYRQTLEETQS